MTIQDNQLYITTAQDTELHIEDGIHAVIFDTQSFLRKVTFGKNSKLTYFGHFTQEGEYDKLFDLTWENSRADIYSLLSSSGENIQAKLHGKVAQDWAYLDMNIVSFVSNGGVIDLDGIVDIIADVAGVEGYLVEENIFLGTSGKVRGLPTLLVHSNDVKASHACNMERISDDKLFYLRSRGLPKDDATVLMLQSYIAKIFEKLWEYDEEMYDNLQSQILESIKQQ